MPSVPQTRSAVSPSSSLLVPLGCGLLAAVYFLSFPNHRYGYDSLDYAYHVKHGQQLFHPHHLLYNAVGRLLYLALSQLASVDALGMLAALNGVVTAGSVGLLCLLLGWVCAPKSSRLAPSTLLVMVLALSFALCRGISYMATSVEVYPATTLFELGALCLLVRSPTRSLRSALGIGLLASLAALFHQTGVFFGIAMAYGLWIRDRSLRSVLWFGLTTLLMVGGSYLVVGTWIEHRPLASLGTWITSYAHSDEYALGMWGHGLRWQSLPLALWGLFSSLTAPYYLNDIDGSFRPSLSDVVLSLAIVGALGVLLRLSWLAWWSRMRSVVPQPADRASVPSGLNALQLRAPLLLWLLLHSLFTIWWECGNFEFWLLILPPLFLLLGDLWRHLELRSQRVRQFLGAMLLLLGLGNLGLSTLPNYRDIDNPAADSYRAMLQAEVRGQPGVRDELAFVGDIGTTKLYFLYFLDRVVPLESLHYVGAPTDSERSSVLAAYRQRLLTLRKTHQLFLMEHELTEPHEQWTAEEIRSVYEPLLAQAKVVGTYHRGPRSHRLFLLSQP
jgi:hypothetical protein